jgi:hypothetical protein
MKPLEPGTHVTYHGSLEKYHDIEFIIERSVPDFRAYIGTREHPEDPTWSADGYKYLIAPADPSVKISNGIEDNYLWNVRRQSFTVVELAVNKRKRGIPVSLLAKELT